MTSRNKPDFILDEIIDKLVATCWQLYLQQVGKIDNLQQVCGVVYKK